MKQGIDLRLHPVVINPVSVPGAFIQVYLNQPEMHHGQLE